MIDYLSTPHYYSENLVDIDEVEESNEASNVVPNSGRESARDNHTSSDTPLDSGDEEVARIGRNRLLNNYVLVENQDANTWLQWICSVELTRFKLKETFSLNWYYVDWNAANYQPLFLHL